MIFFSQNIWIYFIRCKQSSPQTTKRGGLLGGEKHMCSKNERIGVSGNCRSMPRFFENNICVTNKLAALIFFIACCCLLFGKVTFREAASMFAGSFCVFALPYAAERILERISDLNRYVKDWVRG